MDLKNQRRLAAEILGCGINRVWIDPTRIEEVSEAITRGDVRKYINNKAIRAKQAKGISRGRTRYKMSQKKKGKQKGHGSRKGAKRARTPKKEAWIQTIRPIRTQLRKLRDTGRIEKRTYRRLYRRAKGGMFKNKARLRAHLESEGLLKEK